MKCFIQLEDRDKYLRKRITMKQLSALYDLGYMVHHIWDIIKLNSMEDDVIKFFTDIQHINSAKNRNEMYTFDSGNKLRKIKEKRYIHGKPRWKRKKVNSK